MSGEEEEEMRRRPRHGWVCATAAAGYRNYDIRFNEINKYQESGTKECLEYDFIILNHKIWY